MVSNQSEVSPFPPSSISGGSSSSKDTHEDNSGDPNSVFIFQPDTNERKLKAEKFTKELQMQAELDLDLRLSAWPTKCFSPPEFTKDMPSTGDKASCCYGTALPDPLQISLKLTCDFQGLRHRRKTTLPACSETASHSSVASNFFAPARHPKVELDLNLPPRIDTGYIFL